MRQGKPADEKLPRDNIGFTCIHQHWMWQARKRPLVLIYTSDANRPERKKRFWSQFSVGIAEDRPVLLG
jgi:hypothetical protein